MFVLLGVLVAIFSTSEPAHWYALLSAIRSGLPLPQLQGHTPSDFLAREPLPLLKMLLLP